MKKKAATSRHASGRRKGSRSGRTSTRTCGVSVRVRKSQRSESPAATTPKTPSGVRQPPARWASGTAAAAATAEPIVIPAV